MNETKQSRDGTAGGDSLPLLVGGENLHLETWGEWIPPTIKTADNSLLTTFKHGGAKITVDVYESETVLMIEYQGKTEVMEIEHPSPNAELRDAR